MKKVYKLAVDDFDDEDYALIAIHSTLDDYRLAYFINRSLGLHLEKCAKDVAYSVKEGKALFSRFVYDDDTANASWNLLQNKDSRLSTNADTTLFGTSGVSLSICLLPEHKNVDYVLKLENTIQNEQDVVKGLLEINHITTAYLIDHHKLKSKNNLIF